MLPDKLLRFKDLACVGIRNHPTLKRWQESQGFPKGRLLGANTRVWTPEEIEAWWNSKADPPEKAKPGPVGATSGTGPLDALAGNQSNSPHRANWSNRQAAASSNGGA